MTITHLSPEIVSLIHHVELNESGWWTKAVGQVVQTVLWKANAVRTLSELQADLNAELGSRLSDDVLQGKLESLVGRGSVTRMPGPSYKLTEAAHQEMSRAHELAAQEQRECHESFLASSALHCPALDSANVWNEFMKALQGAVHTAGANLFHLLADGNLERDRDWLTSFLSKFDQSEHDALRTILRAFFAHDNHPCRNQVLRLLSAHFFAEASQLRPETLAVIESGRKKRTIKIVLDTNFVFSVLKLHDNPGDDAALSLIDLARKSGKYLDIKLYVLPTTLDEAQRALVNQMRLVEHIRTTTAMARVALTQPLPSIARKFFAAASLSSGLTARTFFQPYIDDLRTILRDKGISVLEAHPAIYHQRQDVIDDVLDEQRREEAELPEAKRKGYHALLHDAVLWHAVNDRRPEGVDSPFEVVYWAVSIDWRLIAFDRLKRANLESKLPVVLHPSNLLQLVQFWVPRSQEMDESLVDSLRLPLFFQSFDPADERATVKVLEAISRFENIGDIPEQTLKVVLANQALRGRLRNSDASNDEAFALVRDELLAEHQSTVAQLEKTQGTLHKAESNLATERQVLAQASAQLGQTVERLGVEEQRTAAAEKRADEAAQARQVLEERASRDAEQAKTNLDVQTSAAVEAQRSLSRHRFSLVFFAFPTLLGAALGYWAHSFGVAALPVLASAPWWVRWVFILGIGLLPLVVACIVVPYWTKGNPHLVDWWLARAMGHVGKKGIAAPLSTAALGVYQGWAWDWVKAVTGWVS